MRNPKSLRIWVARIVLTLFALIIILPMVQTFLYSFASISEMSAWLKTRGNLNDTVWMESHLSPNIISLGQYEQILIKDEKILHFFTNSVMYAVAILVGQALVVPALAFGLDADAVPGNDGAECADAAVYGPDEHGLGDHPADAFRPVLYLPDPPVYDYAAG